ncbi:MAG: class A beta-lactamase-related serine hydrolase [Proteobacteria bacterium]|nr:class A beta-lactamase-related serine hydrolase [Pseudomonadota bacterium]
MRWLNCVIRLPEGAFKAKLFFRLARMSHIVETNTMRRRHFLAATAGFVSAAAALPGAEVVKDHPLASFDCEMEAFMSARKIPGGALAVAKDDRLVYARAYGLADVEKQTPVAAVSLFRIASISKPFTAVAVLQLIEQGRLSLDARVVELLPHKAIMPPGNQQDARWKQITVRHCLQHTGGWDRDKSFDPMFRSKLIATATGTGVPASADAIIRFMLGQPLDFDPGTRYAYSNFGYCLLGRIIERVTGRSYEEHLRKAVLTPCGIKSMRLGRTQAAYRAEREVHYYTPDNATGDNIFPGGAAKVPWPYGGFHLEAMDAHGGWLASAVDLMRFAVALRDPDKSPLLKADTWKQLHSPPPAPVARNEDGALRETFYVCGWQARPVGGNTPRGANYWHSGSLPGTHTLLVRRWDGLSWAVLFNQRQDLRELPDGAIDPALHRAAGAVKEWPKEDLFPSFA